MSKTKPVEAVLHAYASGCRHFGENYVQELVEKAGSAQLSGSAAPGLQWHFIGHLQSNKVKQIARIPNLAMVESVDSRKLASELNKACLSLARPGRLPVLIQVNTSGEASKFGCAPEEAVGLFGHVLASCPALEPRGLMTIGRLADAPQPDCFDLLAKLRREVLDKFSAPQPSPSPSASASAATSGDNEAKAAAASSSNADAAAAAASSSAAAASSSSAAAPSTAGLTVDADSFELSMGMSGDYACAMERGSTIVRVGSTIFGAREYPNKPAPPPRTPSPSKGEQAADKDS